MLPDFERCPACESDSTEEFLHRPSVVVHQNLLMPSRQAARQLTTGALVMRYCRNCGFVFNAAFNPTLLRYGKDYDNSQLCSPEFQGYLDGLIEYLVWQRDVRDCQVVEIGCGNGAFLRRLVAHPQAGISGWGFDPSYSGPDTDYNGRLRFVRRFYDERAADVAADVVICRHVIEHVPKVRFLLRCLRKALAGRENTRVFFETPCVRWVLTHLVVWDFFYEHCSLFTAESLRALFEHEGFDVAEVRHVFGGQYLWLEARPADASCQPDAGVVDMLRLTHQFATAEVELRQRWCRLVQQWAKEGRVAVWGAGAKGVTFANLCDPDCLWIDCLVDVNPAKQGHFVPGAGHPIVAPQQLAERSPAAVIVLNPNYHAEIAQSIARLGIQTHVVNLMDWSECDSVTGIQASMSSLA